MKKTKFYTEASYFLGIIILSFSAAIMTKADFGLSMVVAPAYLLHLKLSQYWSFITFGVAEYIFQGLILILLGIILKKFKISYLFSFVTAVFYGAMLDLFLSFMNMIDYNAFWFRVVLFIIGMVLCGFSVALVLHTYIPPEAYEVFTKEMCEQKGYDLGKFKTIYDCISCGLAIIMSFCFFGLFHFEGVKIGTVICALVNGKLISFFTKKLDNKFEFTDGLKLRKFFEK